MKSFLAIIFTLGTLSTFASDFNPSHCGSNELEGFGNKAINAVCIAKTGPFELSVELEHLDGTKGIYKLELKLITGEFKGQNTQTLERITGQLSVEQLRKKIVEIMIEKNGQFFKGILDPV